ncbi:ABC transporter permease subunit, partial [Mesorhizobium sp. M1D.F.Ca.ET.184.01.1.1]|uniref:ABC transporter permease subunit n=1 Tax=Mesorhizobium sp. M1D.F.Ca.ET.184.01.1.1 TaxID=2563931 RepID=UPI001FDFD30D
ANMAIADAMLAHKTGLFRVMSGPDASKVQRLRNAAQALGLPFLLTLRKVVLPQAVRVVIPPMTSNCVSMFKDTSLASTVALPELLKEATNAQSLYANPSP